MATQWAGPHLYNKSVSVWSVSSLFYNFCTCSPTHSVYKKKQLASLLMCFVMLQLTLVSLPVLVVARLSRRQFYYRKWDKSWCVCFSLTTAWQKVEFTTTNMEGESRKRPLGLFSLSFHRLLFSYILQSKDSIHACSASKHSSWTSSLDSKAAACFCLCSVD